MDSGGKGVNIAGALAAHGHPVTAVLPCGGPEGSQLRAMLTADGISAAIVPISGATRANISIVEPDGIVTKLNEVGPELSSSEISALIDVTIDTAKDAEWLVACGSLPPGVAEDFYELIFVRLAAGNTRVALDTSGPALLKTLSANPDVVKPNVDELSEATGVQIVTLGDAVRASHAMRDLGAATVIASLGPDGALYSDGVHTVHAEAPVEHPRSSVGAGDALLAGFLCNGGSGFGAFAIGVAWAAAALALPGTRMPGPSQVDASRVQVHEHIESDRVLSKGETRSSY